ncbi:MAG: Mth938-like domain-containing protein [Gammaproteobacteria bacterium]|nr:Mth938-like domain-containing protein [Gammaproteobacteria bacterium]MDE2345684.1 Mth938-like domain-containing protein [Gammaproteobacteria bacterium]
MKFTQEIPTAGINYIRAYAPGRINVNDRLVTTNLVLSPRKILENWPPNSPDDITLEHLGTALELTPEILLLGTGARLRFPLPAILEVVQHHGIGLEVLDTAAACRTYNVLVSENRNVVAALLMI